MGVLRFCGNPLIGVQTRSKITLPNRTPPRGQRHGFPKILYINIMQYKVTIDVPESQVSFAEDVFKAISFVKEVIPFEANEVTNPNILQSINSYENKTAQPVPISLEDLKRLIYA